jgi:hypothetical protein
VWAWGDNTQCQTGNTTNQVSQQQVTGLSGISGLVVAGSHTGALPPASTSTTASTTYSYDKLYRLISASRLRDSRRAALEVRARPDASG